MFIKNDAQKEVIEKLHTLKEGIQARGAEADRENSFPSESFQELLKIGYNKLTLPKEYGGDGFGISEMISFQETLASFDGATALAIGWQLGVVGEIYEKKTWSEEQLQHFAQEITQHRALVNLSLIHI